MFNKRTNNSKDNFETPDYLFNQLNARYNFTHDVSCNYENSKCGYGFDKTSDGLKQSWKDYRVFCNPPFSNKKEWIEKAKYEVENGCPIVCMILPCTMETLRDTEGYFQEILPYRVSFIDPETKKEKKGNNHGTVIVHFYSKIKRGAI